MKKSILTLMLTVIAVISFAKTSITVISSGSDYPSKALGIYSGHYKSELIDGFEIDLMIEGGKLYALSKGDEAKVEVLEVSPGKFEMNDGKMKAEFMIENGEVLYMMVIREGLSWLIKEN